MLCGRRYIGKSPKGRKSNGICLAMVASHQVNHVNDVSIMDIFVAEGAHPPQIRPRHGIRLSALLLTCSLTNRDSARYRCRVVPPCSDSRSWNLGIYP
jgi:hypothetical protein